METYNMSKTHNIHLIAALASDDLIYTHNTRAKNPWHSLNRAVTTLWASDHRIKN